MRNIFLPFGRMRRIYYWIIGFVLSFLGNVLAKAGGQNSAPDPAEVLAFAVFAAPLVYLFYMAGMQRAHDIGWQPLVRLWAICVPTAFAGAIAAGAMPRESGADLLQAIALLLGGVCLLAAIPLNLVLLFKRGEVGPNKYGPDPRRRPAANTVHAVAE